MKFQKKYVVLAALALALGTAVYVNWQFSGIKPDKTAKELGAASYVSATVAPSTGDEAVRTSALTNEQESYFAKERTKRQNTQDSVIESARELLNIEEADVDEMNEAQREISGVLKNFTIQDSIESIIRAKGFSECLCCISDDGVTIIVPSSELDDTSALIIDDAVTSHYQVSYDDISITGS
ncbi:MAG: SpoIIIAH-like family protein [Ruminococcus sp.]|nr:SpoIIIAH-like family protein [Ruminococcus sp.]